MNIENLAEKVSLNLEFSSHEILHIPHNMLNWRIPHAMLHCRYALEEIVKYSLQEYADIISDSKRSNALARDIAKLKQILPSEIYSKLFEINDISKKQLHIDREEITVDDVTNTIEEVYLIFKDLFGISLDRDRYSISEFDFIDSDKKYLRKYIESEEIDYTKPLREVESNLFELEKALIHIESIQAKISEFSSNELIEFGIVTGRLGRYDKSNRYFRKAMESFQSVEDVEGESWALSNLSINASHQGELHEALALEKKSLSICIENNLESSRCGCLINLGCLAFDMGDYDSANEYWLSSLQLAVDIDDDSRRVYSMINLAVLCQLMSLIDNSDEYLSNALEIIKKYELVKTSRDRDKILFNMAYNFSERGDFKRAIELYVECLESTKTDDNILLEAKCLNNIGQIKIILDEYDEAKELIMQSLNIYRESGIRIGEAESLGNLSQIVYFNEGDIELAISLLKESLDIDRKICNKLGQAKTLNNLRSIYEDNRDIENTRKYERFLDDILTELGLTIDNIS